MTKLEEALAEIEKQREAAKLRRQGNVRECGRQLRDILCRLNSEDQAAVVLQDFAAGRRLDGCEKEIAAHWKKHSGIETEEAEEIICKYFGLQRPAGEQEQPTPAEKPKKAKLDIDLADFF